MFAPDSKWLTSPGPCGAARSPVWRFVCGRPAGTSLPQPRRVEKHGAVGLFLGGEVLKGVVASCIVLHSVSEVDRSRWLSWVALG